MSNFAGRWFTTFGPLTLTQDGDRVQGAYAYAGREGTLEGRLEGDRLVFSYEELGNTGEGWFQLDRHGKFRGSWRPAGHQHWGDWFGSRGFEGIWETTYGRMRIIQEEGRVFGFYEGVGSSSIEGTLEGSRLVFRYQEPRAAGEGWFELSDDGHSFLGEWKADGSPLSSMWAGNRVPPRPNLTWLVVLEAHWQRGLTDREYSFGGMLKEYFARLENVAVRHRFFDDEAGLIRWCRDLLYCPEPAIVMLASHGTPQGLTVGGQIIACSQMTDILRYADNIQLMHFSACLTMADGEEGPFVCAIRNKVPFPISGYTSSVDWGASAILEFAYLDLILGKRLSPEDAAAQVIRLLSYAGDSAPEGSPYAPAGLRFHSAKSKTPAEPIFA